ncbi:MAG: ABC transporter permease [Thermofilum sp.]|nr:ABC transporter permease [Thermofilum sp.]
MASENRTFLISFVSRHPEIGVLASFLSIALIFIIRVPDRFLTLPTLYSILTLAGGLGVASLGVAFLMIAGEFNLSISLVYAVVPMGVVFMVDLWRVDMLLASVTMLAVAFGIGVLVGYITIKTGIPSFITSLGMMMFLRGILLAVTGGFPVRLEEDHWFTFVLNGPVGELGLRTGAFWLLLLTIIFAFTLDWTPYGNWTYSVGANANTARELGVSVTKVKLINFGLSSLLAGLAGLMALSRFKVVDPTLGQGLELETITSAVLGGCLLAGGYGSIIGTFLGAFLIAMTNVGLVLAEAPPYWYRAFIGIILIIATIINLFIVRRYVTGG